MVANNEPNDGKMNPVAMVTSVFYDPILDPKTHHSRLYVGLRSRGLIAVDCPLCPPPPFTAPNNPIIQCPQGLEPCGEPPTCKVLDACKKQALAEH